MATLFKLFEHNDSILKSQKNKYEIFSQGLWHKTQIFQYFFAILGLNHYVHIAYIKIDIAHFFSEILFPTSAEHSVILKYFNIKEHALSNFVFQSF